MARHLVWGALGIALLTTIGCKGQSQSTDAAPPVSFRALSGLKELAADMQPAVTTAAIRHALVASKPKPWTPQVNDERPRGGSDVYGKVAPAVVVVQTRDGHGSGFLVTADGLLITNHHVIASGLEHGSGGSSATVYLGSLTPDGVVGLARTPVRALLYKVDPVNDLAALKLERATGAQAALPYVKLTTMSPRPGLDCAMIGHPSSGMLWTYRPCQVASVGDFPRDVVNLVMARLAAADTQRAEIEAYVKNMPTRRILLTSAQANPGDSGGPVLDTNGFLIGVTFGGPGDRDQDKFTYHVHVDEVRRFMAQIPASAMVLAPDPWSNLPTTAGVRDLDGDRRPDVLVAGQQMPEVLLFDLDSDTPPASYGSQAALSQLVDQQKWDFEAALDLRGSGYVSYYDVDNDGRYDLVLTTDEDSTTAKGVFTRAADGKWAYQAASGQRIVAGSHLTNAQLGQKLDSLISRMR